MGWLVIVLGSLLSFAGAATIKIGLDIADRDERGWTQVISGSVGLSGGSVTIALGLVLIRLGGLRADLREVLNARRAEDRVAAGPAAPDDPGRRSLEVPQSATIVDGDFGTATPDATHPHDEAFIHGAAEHGWEPPIGAEHEHEHGSPGALTPAESETWPAHVEPAADQGGTPAVPHPVADHPSKQGHHAPETDPTDAGSPQEHGALVAVDGPSAAAHALDAAEAPSPGGAEPSRPSAVVGQYDANGASYIMYADGSIEADTPNGTYRFASIAELKNFIESQDAPR